MRRTKWKINEDEILNNIKLKDRLETLNNPISIDEKIENPVDKLTFKEYKQQINKKSQLSLPYSFWLLGLVVSLISLSILLNSSGRVS